MKQGLVLLYVKSMKKEEYKNFQNIEGSRRKLAYDKRFREWLREHPNSLKDFLSVVHSQEFQESELGDIIKKGDLKITILPSTTQWMTGEYRGKRFKLELNGGAFFIKMEEARALAKGYEELIGAQKAQEALSGLSGLEVYQPKLGYQTESESFLCLSG